MRKEACDQIWRNFTTLAKFKNYLAILQVLFDILQIIRYILLNFEAIGQIFIVVYSLQMSK